MELYQEILANRLLSEKIEIVFPDLQLNAQQIMELECYKALQKIKAIIEDDRLEDRECFMKIEEVVCTFEELGSNGGNRHDF